VICNASECVGLLAVSGLLVNQTSVGFDLDMMPTIWPTPYGMTMGI